MTASSNVLTDCRDIAWILLAFAGFLRSTEVLNLRASDVDFPQSSRTKSIGWVNIRHSKTDVYREGHKIPIPQSLSPLCPLSALRKYFDAAGIEYNSEQLIFRTVISKNGECQLSEKQLSYNVARKRFKSILKRAGIPPQNFGLHSLRSGGASAAAAAGVPHQLIKMHGRWKSDLSKARYIHRNLDQHASLVFALGL